MSGLSLALAASLLFLVVAPILLARSRRFDRYPSAGLAVWSAMVVVGWLSAIVLFLRVGLGADRAPLYSSLGSFLAGLGDGHPLRGVGLREVVGLSLALDVSILLVANLLYTSGAIALDRRRHRSLVDLVASRNEPADDVCVLEHAQPLAYFLPGRGGRVVVTRGALDVLSGAELEAVISHERGHRHGHHGAWLISLQSLSPFVSFVPLARLAPAVMRMYLEMSADDFARKQVSRTALEGALAKVPLFGATPLGAMGFTSDFAERRVERLIGAKPNLVDYAMVIAVVSASISLSWFVVLGRL